MSYIKHVYPFICFIIVRVDMKDDKLEVNLDLATGGPSRSSPFLSDRPSPLPTHKLRNLRTRTPAITQIALTLLRLALLIARIDSENTNCATQLPSSDLTEFQRSL